MKEPGKFSSDLFAGKGEMRVLCREKDWSRTPLGPEEEWCPTLRSTVRTALASPFPINLWCGEDLILIYNDAYRKVLGAKHPEALGRPGAEVWDEIWDELVPMFERIRAGGPAAYAEDEPFVVERAGHEEPLDTVEEPAWFTFSLSPVRDEDGSVVAFFNIVYETTGRVRAEQQEKEARARAERAEARLLEVFERAPSFLALLRCDSDYVFEYVNEAYSDLVGREDLIGRAVFEALPETREQFEGVLNEVVETGETFVGREVPVELKRGPGRELEERYLDFVYYPIKEPDETISGVVAHGYDVTGHVRSRKEAQRARAEAEEASQAKSQFLGTMSHEFRTPVNAILGYTELLKEEIPGSLNEAQHQYLGRVRSSIQHLQMLVGDVLDLAQVEAGTVDVDRVRVSAAETVEDALSLLHPQAREQEIELESVCVDGDRPDVLADPDRVRQILVNLLSNAVDVTPPGGKIQVAFGTARPPKVEEEEPMTFIRVTDTGTGIAADDLETIFQPFDRNEKGDSAVRSGLGLGLAISRELADLMGGCLTAESEVDEGSTFTLWLPR